MNQGNKVSVFELQAVDAPVHLVQIQQILHQIAEKGELRSQEIIDELELSQSAASRHLTQLTAAGYLKERRCDGAKCYSLNVERVSDTLQAVAGYLKLGERSLA